MQASHGSSPYDGRVNLYRFMIGEGVELNKTDSCCYKGKFSIAASL
jgi:hypothetical protein